MKKAASSLRAPLKRAAIPALAAAVLCSLTPAAPASADGSRWPVDDKPRVILMHDPELDDQNTLIRYLLYSNEFNTEALVYSSSGVHWTGDGKGTKWFVAGREYTRFGLNLCPCTSWRWNPGERFIHDAVDIYQQVYPNLRKHADGYPDPRELKSRILDGNIQFDGDISADSPGSDLVRRALLDHRPGPVYLLTGAGQSTIARALKSIKDQYENTPQWPAIYQKVSQKAIIQSFGDQDNTYANYIKPNWPDIEFRQMSTRIWGYGARNAVRPEDGKYLSTAWTKANVSDVGPFGAFYRVWGDGKQMVPNDIFDHFGFSGLTTEQLRAMGYVVWTPPQEKGSWISEGDTSIFMNLLDNGLRGYIDASYGGWGGRSGPDVDPSGTSSTDYASTRWFGAAQEDFAARMKWTVTPRYSAANHRPSVKVSGQLDRDVRRGQVVTLVGHATDPDRDDVTTKWWQYTDADTYPGTVSLTQSSPGRDLAKVRFRVPDDATPGQSIHLVLQSTDDGSPALTSYQRVVLTVKG
ncbi:hypothetical protein Aple_038530 [Acrocarpospora pleiomorpha]|uniref:DUF1593 domain-containing protein n=1 Tax=Acrocarpospora pleiomorpha TaxID=90975 RepID=A0A5M3XHJ8_9ACTN|nr:DUF1593 domain-containing protein [Acrocarpospora pleiomorpha]GES20957.1 hypothetical protein Aple_038530 [Acrocarpospora pleiomorpha]